MWWGQDVVLGITWLERVPKIGEDLMSPYAPAPHTKYPTCAIIDHENGRWIWNHKIIKDGAADFIGLILICILRNSIDMKVRNLRSKLFWSRAELGKYFCLFFGRNENNVICIRDLLTFNTQHRSCGLMEKVSDYNSEDCRFESCHDRLFSLSVKSQRISVANYIVPISSKK